VEVRWGEEMWVGPVHEPSHGRPFLSTLETFVNHHHNMEGNRKFLYVMRTLFLWPLNSKIYTRLRLEGK